MRAGMVLSLTMGTPLNRMITGNFHQGAQRTHLSQIAASGGEHALVILIHCSTTTCADAYRDQTYTQSKLTENPTLRLHSAQLTGDHDSYFQFPNQKRVVSPCDHASLCDMSWQIDDRQDTIQSL